MWRSVITKQHLQETRNPIPLPGGWQRPQEVMESPVESLALPIAGWVARSCSQFVYLVQATELLDQGALKAPTLVGMNTSWNTKPEKLLGQQDPSHSYCLLIPGGDRHSVFAEHVSHCQHVFQPIP